MKQQKHQKHQKQQKGIAVKAKHAWILLLPFLLAGCSWFDDDEEDARTPAVLTPINAEVRLERLWDVKIGRGAEDKAIQLVPGFSGSRIFVAAADGTVKALESGSGREVWQINIEDFYSELEQRNSFSKSADTITGGVGVGEQLVLVGSSAGEVVAINQSDGSMAWRAKTTSEVLAPPQIANQLVVAQSIDGKVAAFNALDGKRTWLFNTSIPSLTLRGTSTPILSDGVMAGFANGRVIVIEKDRGLPVIDQRIAASQGQSDLERLVDIDGVMAREGNILYAASYQGNLVAMDLAQNGRVLWGVPASTVNGVTLGFGNVYLSSADSEVFAYDTNASGRESWKNVALLYRELTAPIPVSSYLAVGDFDGYLHLIAQSDGRIVGRLRIDGDGLRSPAVVDGSRLYILGNSGRLSALELR
jgi:outer membrane protein assembly factor BamB